VQQSSPPEQVLPGAFEPPPEPRRRSRWVSAGLPVVATIAIVVGVVGYMVELPYYTVSPGSSVNVNERITVDGAKTFTPEGELRLLFVRQRARVNAWEWLQASFDSDIDLVKEEQLTGGQSPEEVRTGADAEMALAQLAAKKLALETAGYEVSVAGEGLVVLAVLPSRPAAAALVAGDVVLGVSDVGGGNEQSIVEADDLGEIIGQHEAGDVVAIRIERDGKEQTENVGIEVDDNGNPVIGVYVARLYDFPIDVEIDTSSIGGPSAGLAMTLSIIDTLTPGELTGEQIVAITGTIADDGTVGEIGGLGQKTVAARAADADLFLVPKCGPDSSPSCETDLEGARSRAKGLRIVPVATLDEALAALEDAGGDPLEPAEVSS